MQTSWNTIIWPQFGAAIDMLDNAIGACPDELWRYRLYDTSPQPPELSEFWYLAYHGLFWLDLYLTGTEDGFLPPEPFLLIDQDETGPIPERPYTKDQLQAYLADCRQRCRATLMALTDEAAQQRCEFSWGTVSFVELQLYSMRHVQEHAAQLSLVLGHETGSGPGWEASAR